MMNKYLQLPIAFVLGIVFTLIVQRIRNRERNVDDITRNEIDPPLEEDEYKKRLEKIDEKYENAMAQYDRLIPWASGGALVLSMSFVDSYSDLAPEKSKWLLAVAWLFLVFSLLFSIISQYTSTRIKVWAKNYLQLQQKPPQDNSEKSIIDDWRSKVLNYQKKRVSSGRQTKMLNVLAGVFLIVGLLILGVFAIFAVPFGTGINP